MRRPIYLFVQGVPLILLLVPMPLNQMMMMIRKSLRAPPKITTMINPNPIRKMMIIKEEIPNRQKLLQNRVQRGEVPWIIPMTLAKKVILTMMMKNSRDCLNNEKSFLPIFTLVKLTLSLKECKEKSQDCSVVFCLPYLFESGGYRNS